MAFKTTKANLRQTAVNDATLQVAAEIQAGFVADSAAADTRRTEITAAIFGELVAEADAEVAVAPEKEEVDPNKFTWGKMKGKTIAEVYSSDPDYLDWLVNKDTNPVRNTMRDRVREYIDGLKAAA